ncbi:hypothetical protein B0H15DRAFT_821234 [Mycena belliarum]|uniref:Secreted protein n=1 Tax=Mycena belliarum TaxID=1033014 RepID=A0AAD6XWX6_9AGAR|nr:hypothetical protein B0H15DRAFT_821234 [Mycena belliae]
MYVLSSFTSSTLTLCCLLIYFGSHVPRDQVTRPVLASCSVLSCNTCSSPNLTSHLCTSHAALGYTLTDLRAVVRVRLKTGVLRP